ncbi:MAG: plasmid mobilization protein [Bacteroidia bacterium]
MISEAFKIQHKNGRPKKAVRKEIVRSIRFSKADYFIVKQHASRSGLKITVYIRQMALQGKIISRLSEEERQFVRQLIGMANNLNQLTKKGHQEGLLTAVLLFEKYKNLMDELLEKLREK